MAEAHKPGTFAAVYAFEPVLWPVNPAARYGCSPALLFLASPDLAGRLSQISLQDVMINLKDAEATY